MARITPAERLRTQATVSEKIKNLRDRCGTRINVGLLQNEISAETRQIRENPDNTEEDVTSFMSETFKQLHYVDRDLISSFLFLQLMTPDQLRACARRQQAPVSAPAVSALLFKYGAGSRLKIPVVFLDVFHVFQSTEGSAAWLNELASEKGTTARSNYTDGDILSGWSSTSPSGKGGPRPDMQSLVSRMFAPDCMNFFGVIDPMVFESQVDYTSQAFSGMPSQFLMMFSSVTGFDTTDYTGGVGMHPNYQGKTIALRDLTVANPARLTDPSQPPSMTFQFSKAALIMGPSTVTYSSLTAEGAPQSTVYDMSNLAVPYDQSGSNKLLYPVIVHEHGGILYGVIFMVEPQFSDPTVNPTSGLMDAPVVTGHKYTAFAVPYPKMAMRDQNDIEQTLTTPQNFMKLLQMSLPGVTVNPSTQRADAGQQMKTAPPPDGSTLQSAVPLVDGPRAAVGGATVGRSTTSAAAAGTPEVATK